MELYIWSCFFLTSTAILCVAGLVWPGYHDNLLQCLGMAVLMIGCSSRIEDIWTRSAVPPDWFMVHAGIGLFAYGLLFKVISLRWRRRRIESLRTGFGPDTLEQISRWNEAVVARHAPAAAPLAIHSHKQRKG